MLSFYICVNVYCLSYGNAEEMQEIHQPLLFIVKNDRE